MDEGLLAVVRAHFPRLRLPTKQDRVFKDECLLSFDSPFTDTGLYVNLVTWQGFGEAFFLDDSAKSGSRLYLHEKWDQVPKKEDENAAAAAAVPTELSIGVAGGFNLTESKFDLVKTHHLVIVAQDTSVVRVPLPNAALPEFVSNIIQAIIDHDGMKSQMQLDTWSADSEIFESKYARGLAQLDSAGKKISQDPKTWVCEASGMTENLWLNLSTGYIGGGRKNWDGTGGSGAALQHYIDTGRQFPLCVKLGTITAHGGDVWSYAQDEDSLVKDPLLAEHLSHWGIDIMRLQKTDKTMGELEVDLNLTYDWSRICEAGEKLQPLAGAGRVGLRNIGNSCYLNSVVQALAAVPEIAARYTLNRPHALRTMQADPSADLLVQTAKLFDALLTDRYVDPAAVAAASAAAAAAAAGAGAGAGGAETTITVAAGEAAPDAATLERFVVAPRMFKQLVGRGHAEFSSGRQQCAGDYFLHLIDAPAAAERGAGAGAGERRLPVAAGLLAPEVPSAALFEFFTQTRDVCAVTGQVRYGRPVKDCLLPVSWAVLSCAVLC